MFIGASILTLFEIVDLLFGMACKPKEKPVKQPKLEGVRPDYTDVRAMGKGTQGRACAQASA